MTNIALLIAPAVTSNFADGITLPIPTLPTSSTVTTCDAPSYNLTISAVPLCVTAIPVTVLLFAPTSTLSTPIRFVSSVVIVPSTVKLLLTLRS